MKTPTEEKTMEWEKEFDEQFTKDNPGWRETGYTGDVILTGTPKSIKSFIKALLASSQDSKQKNKKIGAYEQQLQWWKDRANELNDEVVRLKKSQDSFRRKVEGLKKHSTSCKCDDWECTGCCSVSYDKAIDDVLAKLKNIK